MTEADVERLAELFMSSPDPIMQMRGRSIRAFGGIVKWWEGEMQQMLQSDDPEAIFADASLTMFMQMGIVLRSCIGDQPDEFKRLAMATIISSFEAGTDDDVLPERSQIEKMIISPEFLN
jgi:hypothetical protein